MDDLIRTALTAADPDDGQQGRQMRGLAIAALAPIREDKFGWRVPSQSQGGSYLVSLEDGPYCTCPDFDTTGEPCKHVYAVMVALQRGERLDDPDSLPAGMGRAQYGQPWTAYTDAQTHEGDLFPKLLRALCDTIETPPQTCGRPTLSLADMVYACGLKVYGTLSTRRSMSTVRSAEADGQMDHVPHFTTIARYLRKQELTPLLRALIVESALPLSGIEQDFALDSSGFASTAYNRWFDHKWGNAKREVQWVKLHICCGVQTNIVTVADATNNMSADSPYLPSFVRTTAEHFNVREVSADAAYSSWANATAIEAVGATPFIAFKKGAVAERIHRGKPGAKGKVQSNPAWKRMFHHFSLREADFLAHYHRRSNVETCFHMIKSKFRDVVRAKDLTGQVNEVLLKVLCHNLSVLIRAMYNLGIEPDFEAGIATDSLDVAQPADN